MNKLIRSKKFDLPYYPILSVERRASSIMISTVVRKEKDTVWHDIHVEDYAFNLKSEVDMLDFVNRFHSMVYNVSISSIITDEINKYTGERSYPISDIQMTEGERLDALRPNQERFYDNNTY